MSNLYHFYREAAIGEVQEKGVLKTLKKSWKNMSKVVHIKAESLKRNSLLEKISFTSFEVSRSSFINDFLWLSQTVQNSNRISVATSEICSKLIIKIPGQR